MTTTDTPSAPSRPEISKQAWAQLAVHTITCPTGAVVRIRIPDLAMLLAGDAVPDHLRATALELIMAEIRGPQPAAVPAETQLTEPDEQRQQRDLETIKEVSELHLWLIAQMLLEPAYTADELREGAHTRPPSEDMFFLTQIARRERDTDARGVKLGVDRLSRWERFRHHHGCPEGCEACSLTVQDFSSARLGGV